MVRQDWLRPGHATSPPATHNILDRQRMKIGDLDFMEINEAFASVLGAWLRGSGPASIGSTPGVVLWRSTIQSAHRVRGSLRPCSTSQRTRIASSAWCPCVAEPDWVPPLSSSGSDEEAPKSSAGGCRCAHCRRRRGQALVIANGGNATGPGGRYSGADHRGAIRWSASIGFWTYFLVVRSAEGTSSSGTRWTRAVSRHIGLRDPLFGGRSGKPVTNQVTTPPGNASQSATHPDGPMSPTCGNPTPSDSARRNRQAWHARGQGFESPKLRDFSCTRSSIKVSIK
jgi:Thiolase, C-terminal domain